MQIDENGIAYARFRDMVKPDEAPIFYDAFQTPLMENAKSSKGLIIDIRGNGGGSQHLITELAKYVVHPDAIHVVNVAQQRCNGGLTEDMKAT